MNRIYLQHFEVKVRVFGCLSVISDVGKPPLIYSAIYFNTVAMFRESSHQCGKRINDMFINIRA